MKLAFLISGGGNSRSGRSPLRHFLLALDLLVCQTLERRIIGTLCQFDDELRHRHVLQGARHYRLGNRCHLRLDERGRWFQPSQPGEERRHSAFLVYRRSRLRLPLHPIKCHGFHAACLSARRQSGVIRRVFDDQSAELQLHLLDPRPVARLATLALLRLVHGLHSTS